MRLATLILSKVNVIDAAAVEGECDRIVPAGVVKQTAARYQHAVLHMPRSDHMVFRGFLPVTMSHIDDWLIRNQLLSNALN
jgi:hypothetical protein